MFLKGKALGQLAGEFLIVHMTVLCRLGFLYFLLFDVFSVLNILLGNPLVVGVVLVCDRQQCIWNSCKNLGLNNWLVFFYIELFCRINFFENLNFEGMFFWFYNVVLLKRAVLDQVTVNAQLRFWVHLVFKCEIAHIFISRDDEARLSWIFSL